MYKIESTTNKNAMTESPPSGPGFAESDAVRASHMEIWGTNFDDPGPDCTEFRLFDANGNQIGSKRVGGY